MNNKFLCLVKLVMGLTLMIAALPQASAEEFYAGKMIRIVAGFPPGGGYDIYSRLIGRHLRKHVPGSPSIIVQNMPGAASVIGANYLYRIAPRDGTAVGIFLPQQVLRQVIGVPGIAFESDKFNWLVAAYVSDVTTCIATAASGVKNLGDAITRKEPLIVAASNPGSPTLLWPRAYKEILGANFKIVQGYRGTPGIRAAMARGEADAGCWSWSSVKVTAKDMLDTGAVVVFTQAGVKSTPELPGVENALDRAKTKTDRQVLTALLSGQSTGRSYVAPPDVPGDRVQLLRKAFLNTLGDPALLEDANRVGLEIDPLPGKEVQSIVTDLKKLPREVREKLRSMMEP